MDAGEDIVPPPYVLEDVAPPAASAFSLRISDSSLDSGYSHGLHLGRAPQLRRGLFVGRDAELNRLSQLLLPGASTRNVVAIAAVGGLGKTQLAITYAERYHHKYSAIFWLDAKDESTLKQGLAGLADIVLDPGQTSAATAVDEEITIKQVKYWFSLPNNNRWLLILDNYDDPKVPGLKSTTGYDIRSFFPSRNQGSILITTRSKKLDFAESLALGKLEDVEQSLEILSIRSGLDLAHDSDAKALATRLAGFPLALTTAGAYLGQSSGECSAQDYLALYDLQWDELEENADQLLEYEDRTLFSTWNLSLEQVRQQNANAARLLRLLAFFGSSGITFELFRLPRDRGRSFCLGWLNDLTESKVIFNKAMAALQNYSLVEHSPQGYSLHTCVHDWTLQALNKGIELEYFWDAMFCIANNVTPNSRKDYWQNNQRLLQHATRLWQIRLKNPSTVDVCNDDQVYSLEWAGILWSNQRMYDRAAVLLSSALSACEELRGSFHHRTLSLLVSLADAYDDMYRSTEAEDMYRRALEGYQKVSLPDEILPARIRHNLGLSYLDQGKFAEAEQVLREALAREALATVEVVPEIERIITMQIADALAVVLGKQDRFPEAEALCEKAIEGLTTLVGPDHPTTLEAISTSGELHSRQKQWEQAAAIFRLALDSSQRILGSDHELTLRMAKSLGKTYWNDRKLDELVKFTRMWGEKVKDLYESCDDLGYAYLRDGDEAKARIAFASALHLEDGVLSYPSRAWCDMCEAAEGRKVYIILAIGRFKCLQCDDMDLCRMCYEKHQAGKDVLASCVGHAFFEMPWQRLEA